jgi:hypothetical protein
MDDEALEAYLQTGFSIKPQLSLGISLSASSDANELTEALSNEEGEISESMEEACQLVQRLLDQVAWNDAPPSNDELSSPDKVALKIAKSPRNFSRQTHFRHETPAGNDDQFIVKSDSTDSYDPAELWRAHYQRRSNPAERKMGNVALATLCARTLETVGKPSLPTREASGSYDPKRMSKRINSPKLSSWRRPESPKKKWLRRKTKRQSPPGNAGNERVPRDYLAKLPRDEPEYYEMEGRDDDDTNLSSIEADEVDSSRLQMFGSEYARYLSTTALAPKDVTARNTVNHPRGGSYRRRVSQRFPNLKDADPAVLTGAITDVVITYGDDVPPKGYFRISQTGDGDGLSLRDRKTSVYINVKKEPNWDRAAQRPCVTALAIIFPERKEFVPPGFCVVRRHKAIPNLPGEPTPANLNVGGEPVYMCFRRSREGNPITGIVSLQPSKREPIPEGYTVMERTPRNHVANITTTRAPVFLAFRQRLANLEPLRPLPLVISVHNAASSTKRLQSYYCTGGTVVDSKVGRFHIMDRSTHSLLSPSSVSNRLSLIGASRRKALNSLSGIPSGIGNNYSSSNEMRPPRSSSELLTSSLLLAHGLNTPGSRSVVSDLERMSVSSVGDFESVTSSSDHGRVMISPDHHYLKQNANPSHSSASVASDEESANTPLVSASSQQAQNLCLDDDEELQRCLEALSFIPVVSTAVDENDPKGMLRFQARVAVLTPVLTACYTRHGGSALIAVEGLTSLLRGDFFSSDVNMENDSSSRITLLDVAVQVVCDVATTGAQETHLHGCVEFVEAAVKYGCGHLNTRTVGYALRFYLFVFYFGASIPTRGTNPVWGTRIDIDEFMLDDPRSGTLSYLPGGAPQSAALSLKDLISFSIGRLKSLTIAEKIEKMKESSSQPEDMSPPEFFNGFLDNLLTEIVDDSVHRVDVANYTQLAMHQIHRSGGSELFWYDMMNSCGVGLFGSDIPLREEGGKMYSMCFAILANLIKVACTQVRRDKQSEAVPRDIASKLLSLELIHFFLERWADARDFLEVPGSRSVATFAFCVRRLVVPCLLFNTEEALNDPRVFRRTIRIVGLLWCSPVYRSNMRLELGILVEHFVLKMLQLGPQFPSKSSETMESTPPLLEQQIDLMKEITTWFTGDSRDLLELFINFDTKTRTQQGNGPMELLSGIQCDVCQRLIASLCIIAEQCSEFIGQQIRASQSMSSVPSPQEEAEARETIFGENSMRLAREGAQRLRKATLEAISQMVRSLAETAARASGSKFRTLLQSWTTSSSELGTHHIPINNLGKDGDNDDDSITSFTSAEGDAGLKTKRDSILLPKVSSRVDEGNASIVGYWQRAIITRKTVRWADNDTTKSKSAAGSRPKIDNETTKSKSATGSRPKADNKTTKSKPATGARPKIEIEDSGPVYSGISRVGAHNEAEGKIDHLGIAFDIAKKKSLNKAIDYLIACDILTKSPRDIASFLRIHKDDLKPSDLGRYLGEGGTDGSETEYWNLIRFNYIRAHSFVGMGAEQGYVELCDQYCKGMSAISNNFLLLFSVRLRHLLTNCGFQLPGEAQQIDRIMCTFAQCYWEDNAGDNLRCPFQDQDTVFLLSFAIIMLNTDLHKSYTPPSHGRKKDRKRMTKTEFLTNMRGATRTEELSQEYLSKIYDSIEDNPIVMDEQDIGETSSEPGESLETSLASMVGNVKAVDALLRGLSVHEHRFTTVEDFSQGHNNNMKEAMGELTRDFMTKTWHHFHGLINAAIEMAHLDLQGMESCVHVLKYALCLTICLDMPVERAAFLGQLGRYKLFNAWRRGLAGDLSADYESIKEEDWYLGIEEAFSKSRNEKGKISALEKVHSLISDLGLTLAVNVDGRKALKEAVEKLQHGEHLLNDPGRLFIRQGNLLKRANRSGRCVEYRFFLFSDMLIYAKKIGGSSQYHIHEELPLILMKVVDWFPPDLKKESKRAFQIFHPRKNLLVLCASKEERASWVNAIRTAVDQELERKVAIEAARMAAAKSH